MAIVEPLDIEAKESRLMIPMEGLNIILMIIIELERPTAIGRKKKIWLRVASLPRRLERRAALRQMMMLVGTKKRVKRSVLERLAWKLGLAKRRR